MVITNQNSFARGVTFRRPFGVKNILFNRLLFFLYRIIEKIKTIFSSYMIWSVFNQGAIIGQNCRLGKDAYLTNKGDKRNVMLGNTVVIKGILYTGSGGKIQIGDNVYIGDNTILSSYEEIKIGSNVLISNNVNIFDNDSHPKDHLQRQEHFLAILRGQGDIFGKDKIAHGKIVIEDNVWISFNCSILKGVTIGKGAIIGAGSIVVHDVPPFAVITGIY